MVGKYELWLLQATLRPYMDNSLILIQQLFTTFENSTLAIAAVYISWYKYEDVNKRRCYQRCHFEYDSSE